MPLLQFQLLLRLENEKAVKIEKDFPIKLSLPSCDVDDYCDRKFSRDDYASRILDAVFVVAI